MALIKLIALPTTAEAVYWKIISIHDNYVTGTTLVKLAGYASKEAREAYALPLDQRDILWDTEIETRADAYVKIKNEVVEFSGATDDPPPPPPEEENP